MLSILGSTLGGHVDKFLFACLSQEIGVMVRFLVIGWIYLAGVRGSMGNRLGSKFDAPSTQLLPNAVKCENLRKLNQNV
jgi:hypothetical protein